MNPYSLRKPKNSTTILHLSCAFVNIDRIKNPVYPDRVGKRRKLTVDKLGEIVYNILAYGAAMVSTGILRYDKRGGLG